MPYCPTHGPKQGRHCDECGAELLAAPLTGDSLRIRSPEAHATVNPTFILPGAKAGDSPPVRVKCPRCGRKPLDAETFDCVGPCGRQHLCERHFDEEYEMCQDCANAKRGIAEQEAARQAQLQDNLKTLTARAQRLTAELAQVTAARDVAQSELAEARANVRRAEQHAQAAAAAAQAELAGAQKTLSEWRARAEQAEAKLAQAVRERDARQAELAQAQGKLVAAQAAAERAAAEWQAKAAALEASLAEWRGRGEKAEAQLAEIRRKEQEAAAARRAELQRQQAEAEAAARRKTLLLELAPDVTLELVRVPAGEFLMGSDKTADPQAYDDELPQHRLSLPDFLIGKHPVTVAQFAAFVAATGYKTTAEARGSGWNWTGSEWKEIKGANWQHPRGPDSGVANKANHPVTLVSWYDAVAFCEWASKVTGRAVRLPSEAEWEKAACGGLPSPVATGEGRGGGLPSPVATGEGQGGGLPSPVATGEGQGGGLFPWGNAAPTDKLCNFNMNVKDTTPIGRYSPAGDSPYGCTDMAGNVWEWTGSLWGKDGAKPAYSYPYVANDGREDQGAGTDVRRVLRGGSFSFEAQIVRCAVRDRSFPEFRFDYLGFRVASPGL